MRAFTLFLAVVAGLLAVAPAGAEEGLSDRPVTIVVPFTPGTGPDILARMIGDELQKRWNQTFVIENKPGATGNIGTGMVARAAPDGHTLLMTSNPFTANVSLLKSIPYDPLKSFAPIIEVGVAALALAAHPSVPAKSIKELVAYLQAKKGDVDYSSPGIGGPHHLAMELFKLQTKVDAKHIPYKGSAGALQDLVAGHVSLGFVPPHTSSALAHEGKLRFLAVASKERVKIEPDLPTFAEQGLPGFEVELWYGLLAPAETPPAIVARYNTAVNEILQMPHILKKLDSQGLIPVGGTPDRLGAFLATDLVKWRDVVAQAGITSE